MQDSSLPPQGLPQGFLPRIGAWLFGPQVKRLREQIGRTHWLSYLLIIAQSVAVVLVFGHAEVPLLFSPSLAVRAFAVMTLFVLIATVIAADIALPETIIRVAPLARNRQSGMLAEHMAYVLFILATEGVTYGVVLMKVDGDPQSLISNAPLIPTTGALFLALVVMRVVLICWSAVQLIIVRAKLPVLLSTLMNTSKEIVGAHVEQQLKEMDVRHIPVRATFNVYARMTQAPRPVAGLFNGWAVKRALARETEEARQVENIRAALAELNAYGSSGNAASSAPSALSLDPAPPTIPLPLKRVLPTRTLTHEERRRLLEAQQFTGLDEYDPDEDSADEDSVDDGDALAFTRQPHPTHPRQNYLTGRAYRNGSNGSNGSNGASSPARIEPSVRYSEVEVDLPTGRTARKGDTPEARRVMNYLDKHPGSTISQVMAKTGHSKPTVRRAYTAWLERNRRFGEAPPASFTEEMAAITQDMLAERPVERIESIQ